MPESNEVYKSFVITSSQTLKSTALLQAWIHLKTNINFLWSKH